MIFRNKQRKSQDNGVEERSFMSSWFRIKPGQIREDGSEEQFDILFVVLFALGLFYVGFLNSMFGGFVAAVGLFLITFKNRVGPMATKLLYLVFFTLIWIPIGRVIEYHGYAVLSLIVYASLAAYMILGGKSK